MDCVTNCNKRYGINNNDRYFLPNDFLQDEIYTIAHFIFKSIKDFRT